MIRAHPGRRWPLGIVRLAYPDMTIAAAAAAAAAVGFDHIDVSSDELGDELALTVGLPFSLWDVVPGCSTMPSLRGTASWDEAVARLRSRPNVVMEPIPGSVCDSIESARAMLEAVPGLRMLVDTGHVAAWGEDPVELLDQASFVQLRQARRGVPQVHVDDGGDVDFKAVLARLDAVGYEGPLSIEYFDLAHIGMPLADPLEHALALARLVEPILAA